MGEEGHPASSAGELAVAGHLYALVPGQRPAGDFRQAGQNLDQAIADSVGVMPGGQVDQAHVSAGAGRPGCRSRIVHPAGDQVAFRKTEPGPGGPGVAEVALRSGRLLGMSARPSLGCPDC